MDYKETLEYIHSINWTFCKPGLERIRDLCKRLGNPQNNVKFIHVAGTNGKGSFCSMLSSVLIEQGYKVGLYTSPYIKCFNERMMINGEMIGDNELIAITEQIKPIADAMEDKPTEFELVTAIAFEYFSRNKCDYVVLECGLGGRLDSTNIITTPVLSVITGIALDHTSILGDSVDKIAYEKAGIIKTGVPCLYCGEDETAYEVIKEIADEKKSRLYRVDHSATKIKNATLDGTFFDFGNLTDLEIKLLGIYQTINASNVLSAIQLLNDNGVIINEKSIRNGLKNAKWSARFEKICENPKIYFDGGHNPQGVDACVESIKQYFKEEKLYFITGVMADKDYEYIASKISQVAEKVFCITPNNPRALNAQAYTEVFQNKGTQAKAYNTVSDAIVASMEDARENKRTIFCLGSLYMYTELVDALDKCNKEK
ncbi:MAG: bifunctional folylpolyglutamate synthase/dihydrofolate synthase [Clostridia bacterium]|nr:bifunctional folylpolyglutamate synthase/dihydrofolate synthase [Clostridia bacterium]